MPDRSAESTRRHLAYLGYGYAVFAVLGLLGLAMLPMIDSIVQFALNHPQGGSMSEAEFAAFEKFVRVLKWCVVALTLTHVLVYALTAIGFFYHKWYWACFVSALLTCLAFPLGTALGILSIIVMLRPDAKGLFGLPAPEST